MININEKNGFTLLEVMITLVVISLGLTGAFMIIKDNFAVASRVKNNMIAAHLAQEGVEVVRNIRDGEWHSSLLNFGDLVQDGDNWAVQWNSNELDSDNSDNFLKIDNTTAIYSYDSGNPTIFKRKIEISSAVDEESFHKIVTVYVNWSERGTPKSVRVEEHLYDWK